VIDVNGWSFVKGNDDYYDKCSSILKELFRKVASQRINLSPAKSIESQWRLKAFLSVLRVRITLYIILVLTHSIIPARGQNTETKGKIYLPHKAIPQPFKRGRRRSRFEK
jgi:hypothetical protein